MEKQRILIVDDEPDLNHMVKHALEATGEFEVAEETDGLRALQLARAFKPDLVLLDIMMPNFDGGDMALCMSTDPELRSTPVVFLTAMVMKEEVAAQGGVIGGHRYLAKPVDTDELVNCVRRTLAAVSLQ
jgi:two-component system alkaline phosphatase synthesis response regulator PhoP